ncbi:hypothetical protein BpHYR1_023819 [Brachionus plicatilis]|uniref:Uncharacterized protein n=1 Tax=Brachionus plicatilis TaxID=10195 RepID=A0A3M7RNX2_BRAPC|nr:hypothetical protein BpHYR1_023819 [Brachionus plicatilis]
MLANTNQKIDIKKREHFNKYCRIILYERFLKETNYGTGSLWRSDPTFFFGKMTESELVLKMEIERRPQQVFQLQNSKIMPMAQNSHEHDTKSATGT